MKIERQKPFWLIKLMNYEFWPTFWFYMPVYPYGLWLALKARSLTYFTAINPGMNYSGLFLSSKFETLSHFPESFLPKMVYLGNCQSWEEIVSRIQKKSLAFPCVLKPDMGERGKHITLIAAIEDLYPMHKMLFAQPFVLQEFINYPLELGVFYHRHGAEKKGSITSIVVKEFLEIVGDGKSTLKSLIILKKRARLRKNYLFQKYDKQLDEVLAKGSRMWLEPIGNHSRGTKFINGNYLIDTTLESVFDKIAQYYEGYHYGRFDIKAQSISLLKKGQGFKIMEINGVNSEPAHIYDPAMRLRDAYKDIYKHMRIVYSISKENHRDGIPYMSLATLFKGFKMFLKQNKIN